MPVRINAGTNKITMLSAVLCVEDHGKWLADKAKDQVQQWMDAMDTDKVCKIFALREYKLHRHAPCCDEASYVV
ncbi:hypothetical protein ACO0LK_21395 [Undibacterium sp. Ji49W]